ncbi:MAG TPA: helix-turn-helix domain-containing protein [Candidatus Thermoplasmatota archaeon]|nr:helix-turn-helix domain-containing protein [Candidatus Thermoplasmatota archaeon]
MTFTEVAFELGDPRHPFCRMTRAPFAAHVIYRVTDLGGASGRHRAHVSVHARPEAAQELVTELRALRPDGSVEVLYQGQDRSSLAVDAPLIDEAPAGLAAVGSVFARHGIDAILDPLVAHEGRIHVRLVVPREADAQEVLRALQEVQRLAGFADFRILRIAPASPSGCVETARRPLSPEQEAVLALAASMGYYDTPKAVTLEQIARSVGLSISPVHKRLKAAEESIVTQHVAHARPEMKRRPRRPTRIEPTSPWELQLRVRGDFGPVNVLKDLPDARASLHVLSGDGARAQSSLLVVVAPDDAQRKLLSGLEDRPEIASASTIDKSAHHLSCRLDTRERGTYAFTWWNDAWGHDAPLRSVVFQGGEAHVRALVTRPFTRERFEEKLESCARAAGWTEWEVESLRSLDREGPPPVWPEPLTQRQLEVLKVAQALGYYRTPRECTLEAVANTLGVSANAVHKNLVLAESKLIHAYLAAGI